MTITQTFRTLATDLFATFEAQACTVRSVVSVYNPATLGTVITNTDFATKTIIAKQKIKNRAGETIIATVATIAAESLASAPQSDDLLITAFKTYRIASIETVAPSGIAIVYKLILGES